MNYNLNDPRQYHEALDFIEHARQNNIIISIDRKKENRTIQQNKYYWLILRYFGLKYGCPRADAEYYFKQVCNQDIFCRTKTDKQGRTLYIVRSSADLSKSEMISAINNFIVWSRINMQIEIPRPEDKELLRYVEQEVERNLSWT